MNETLLRFEDVERMLGISRETIYRMIKRGEIPTVRIGMRNVRFSPSDIDRLVQKSTQAVASVQPQEPAHAH